MQARRIIAYLFIHFVCIMPFYVHSRNLTILHATDTVNHYNIGYLFAHGLGATQEQAYLFLEPSQWIIKKPTILFDFPDAKNNMMEYHHEYVNLGQTLDIEKLTWALDQAHLAMPENKFVVMGLSRGAVAALNATAMLNNNTINQPSFIAALVLESPFDTIKNVIKHLLRRFCVGWIPYSKELAYKIAKKNFPLLNIDGIVPLNIVSKISKEIPIIIIHSQRDKTISIDSSRNLYLAFLNAGHPHVYFLELASGDHGKLLQGIEGDLYRNVVHAFYKKYNLPCNPLFAQIGETMLRYCQPTVDEIHRRMRKTRGVFYEEETSLFARSPIMLDDDDFLIFPFLFL